MRRTPRVLSTALVAVLSAALLSGCLSQPEPANNNGPQPDAVQPSDVVRS